MSQIAFRFVLSAEAGKGLPRDLPERIKSAFAGKKPPDIQVTNHAGHVAELSREWAEEYGANGVVYACGGDGTLHEVAEELKGGPCAFGGLPFGTGNDFAKTLYGTRKVEKIVDDLIRRTPEPQYRKIDLLKVNDTICLNVLSLGFDTVVLENALRLLERWPWLGKSAYAFAVVKTLTTKKDFPLRFELTDADGKHFQEEHTAVLLAAGNGRYYGSGYQPLPDALLDDGLGDFLMADTMSLFELLPLIGKYRQGTHLDLPKVFNRRFTRAVIESADDTQLPANVDGVIFHAKRIEVEVMPSALRLAFPG